MPTSVIIAILYQDSLKEYFSGFGHVIGCQVKIDANTNTSRYFYVMNINILT